MRTLVQLTASLGLGFKMLGKLIGQKYVSIAKSWVPTMALWGSVGGVALVYFTDWRVILDYVPYVNGKFKDDE